MTTSTLAFGKANVYASLRSSPHHIKRSYGVAGPLLPTPNGNVNGNGNGKAKAPNPAVQRELFLEVLHTNATKRDAKQYLARFKPLSATVEKLSADQVEANVAAKAQSRLDKGPLERIGVNLGGLYGPTRSIAESPQFTRIGQETSRSKTSQHQIHVALICLRQPETLDDTVLDGMVTTLSQLVKLDMQIVLVVQCGDSTTSTNRVSRMFAEESQRLIRAFSRHNEEGCRAVNGALERQPPCDANSEGSTVVAIPSLILEPLKRSIVPLVPTLAYTHSCKVTAASTTEVMFCLTDMMSGLSSARHPDHASHSGVSTSLDRIILLDRLGGIPSKTRRHGTHVFINLEQEYHDIEAGLAESNQAGKHQDVPSAAYQQHRENLRTVRSCLKSLPSASSAIIITPEEAAGSSRAAPTNEDATGAGTRRQKNPLIHNLLTNKPQISSSLPFARLPPDACGVDHAGPLVSTATMIKRGMPLTIIPSVGHDATNTGWQPPLAGHTTLDLEADPRVDLSRLLHLIEDSFRRKINAKHYLSRIRGRTAGLIVAGSYEGAAILTWETPPPSSSSAPRGVPVPYLDKFAVLSSSQGSSGVADIVFQAMVHTCFPRGVCWRSRADNPVNKWYFERSVGTWKIPGSGWTMFWTGEGVVEDEARWADYVGVCRGVVPSWADGTKLD